MYRFLIISLLCICSACTSSSSFAELKPQPRMQQGLEALYEARKALQSSPNKTAQKRAAIAAIDQAIRLARQAVKQEWQD